VVGRFLVDLIVLNQPVLVVIVSFLLLLKVFVHIVLVVVVLIDVEYVKNLVEKMVPVDDQLLLNRQHTVQNHDFLVNVKVNVHF
jgi:hypothetical protein